MLREGLGERYIERRGEADRKGGREKTRETIQGWRPPRVQGKEKITAPNSPRHAADVESPHTSPVSHFDFIERPKRKVGKKYFAKPANADERESRREEG
jgi:hypothetical protein